MQVHGHDGQEQPRGIRLRLEGARKGRAPGVTKLAKESGTVELIEAAPKGLAARLPNVDELGREGRRPLRRTLLELRQHVDARQFERQGQSL